MINWTPVRTVKLDNLRSIHRSEIIGAGGKFQVLIYDHPDWKEEMKIEKANSEVNYSRLLDLKQRGLAA